MTVTTPGGTSAIVSGDQFTYTVGPPPTPTGLSANLGVGSATLSWTAPNDNGERDHLLHGERHRQHHVDADHSGDGLRHAAGDDHADHRAHSG